MNGALIIRWRAELARALQAGEITIQEGIDAMRAIDGLEKEPEIKIVAGKAA